MHLWPSLDKTTLLSFPRFPTSLTRGTWPFLELAYPSMTSLMMEIKLRKARLHTFIYHYFPVSLVNVFKEILQHHQHDKNLQEFQLKLFYDVAKSIRIKILLQIICECLQTLDGNFEKHLQFFSSIAQESLKEGLREHFSDMVVSEEEQTLSDLERMIRNFLKSNNIVPYWGAESDKPFDDLHRYHSRLVAAHLMNKVHKLYAKSGDGQGLRTVNRVSTAFFLNQGGQKSKYAKYTLKDNVCHDSSSDQQKRRNDLSTTVNAWGGASHSVESDKFQEHKIKNIKGLLDNLHGNLDPANIEKTLRSADLELKISAELEKSMNVSYTNPESSRKYMTEEEVKKVGKTMTQIRPFSRDRSPVQFVDPIVGNTNFSKLEEDASVVLNFLLRNRDQYPTWGPFV